MCRESAKTDALSAFHELFRVGTCQFFITIIITRLHCSTPSSVRRSHEGLSDADTSRGSPWPGAEYQRQDHLDHQDHQYQSASIRIISAQTTSGDRVRFAQGPNSLYQNQHLQHQLHQQHHQDHKDNQYHRHPNQVTEAGLRGAPIHYAAGKGCHRFLILLLNIFLVYL